MLAYLGTCYIPKSKSNEIGLSKPDQSDWELEIKEDRFQAVNKVAAKLQAQGITVISPITQNHLLHIDHGLDGDFEFWQHHNLQTLIRCDVLFVLMLPGWRESEGLQAEIAFAQQKGMPIIYIDEDLKIGG
jgi:hypothetical protein